MSAELTWWSLKRGRDSWGARGSTTSLSLRWWVTHLGTTAMSTRIDVVREGKSLVEGEMRHVFVEEGTTNKMPIPPEIRAPLERYLAVSTRDGEALSSS